MKKIIINFAILLMLTLPVLSFALVATPPPPEGLIPCDGTVYYPCGFDQFIHLINNIIHFALFDLALPIAAVMFAYAGFKLVTSGGNTEARNTAKNVFTNTAIGLVLAFACWVIVKALFVVLGYNGGGWIGF
jgi:hypothetical protein